eukprot:767072-Hanusia_phi.AAC.6
MVTFSWADTSEGKGGLEIKDELVHANTSIALVSTLTWSIVSCSACGPYEVILSTRHGICSLGLQQIASANQARTIASVRQVGIWKGGDYQPFSSCSQPFLLFCKSSWWDLAIDAKARWRVDGLVQVYEMSDEPEVEAFFDMLGKNTQLPGAVHSLLLLSILTWHA